MYMRVFGIRREVDTVGAWSGYVVGAVNLLNEHLNPRGKYFYFDEIDAYASDIGGYKVYDMYGWVIDVSERGEFEPLWFAEADRHAAISWHIILNQAPHGAIFICVGSHQGRSHYRSRHAWWASLASPGKTHIQSQILPTVADIKFRPRSRPWCIDSAAAKRHVPLWFAWR